VLARLSGAKICAVANDRP